MDKPLEMLVNLVHLLSCDKPHAEDMMEIRNRKPGHCYYYLEQTMEKTFELEDHLKYHEKCLLILSILETEDPGVALGVLKSLLDPIYELNNVLHKYKKLQPFLRKIVERLIIP